MFTIIFEDKNGKLIDSTYFEGSEKLFVGNQKLKCLNQLSSVDYDVFASSNMDIIIQDLYEVKTDLRNKESIEYVDKALLMAKLCKRSLGSTLTFTPFGL